MEDAHLGGAGMAGADREVVRLVDAGLADAGLVDANPGWRDWDALDGDGQAARFPAGCQGLDECQESGACLGVAMLRV